jgi:hypothetical protein
LDEEIHETIIKRKAMVAVTGAGEQIENHGATAYLKD